MGGSVAERRGVLEGDEPPRRHFARGGRMVMLEHVGERFPQECKIIGREARPLSKLGRDEAMGPVKAVWNDVLTTHGAVLAADVLVGPFLTLALLVPCRRRHAG